MKTKLAILFTLMVLIVNAQHTFFTHVATQNNIFGNSSYLEHPLLNGNPDAIFIVTHHWGLGDSSGVYNNKVTGTYYLDGEWVIYNEDFTPMVENSGYNIYVELGNQAFVHIADVASQGNFPGETILNHPLLNNNPDANAVITNTWIGVNNNKNYGLWYNGTINRWLIYAENLLSIPENAAFFVVAGVDKNQDVIAFTHVVTTGNSNTSVIDHPLLNDNEDAIFVLTHNWGSQGDPSNTILDTPVSVSFFGGIGWLILTEDLSHIPLGTIFNVMVDNSTLSTTEHHNIKSEIYPNPATNLIHFEAQDVVESIVIYNTLGNIIWQDEVNSMLTTIDISNLTNGTYFIHAKANGVVSTQKFIKK